jgi:hypothetical protein
MYKRISDKQKSEITMRLKQGQKVPDIARSLGIRYNTLWGYLNDNKKRRLHRPTYKKYSSLWVNIIGFGIIIALNLFIFWIIKNGK